MRRACVAMIVLAAAPSLRPAPCAQSDLRSRVAEAGRDGISSDELVALSDEAFALARESSSRVAFWNAVSLVSELCSAGPFAATREVRARALGLLARHDSDTLRWSSLVTKRFLPAFARIPRSDWAHELAEYDRVLDELRERATSDRVRAELLYAKAFGRVFINRRWDWLSEAELSDTIERLAVLQRRFEHLPIPGTGKPEVETVGARAKQHEYELTNLRFGAPAPRTSGVDLENAAIDIADHAGQVVVLDFWTTFCQPCLALVPGVRRLMDELVDEPVVYIGVNGDTDRLAGLATRDRVGMTWRNLWDPPRASHGAGGPVAIAWNVPALGWPSVFVLDAQGRIRFKLRGKEQVDDRLEASIRALLAEQAEQPEENG